MFDPLEDMLASGAKLSEVLSLALRQADMAADYDGPPTVRDVELEGPDTSPCASYPTQPCVYSRAA